MVEAPTYLGAIMAFRGYEADLRGVPMDDDGMRVDVLADLLATGLRPKVLYTIPDHQNPTGLSMAADRRAELVDLARRYHFLILEDVAYRELGFEDTAPPSLWSQAPDVVVQAGTFSKTFFPGVRLGWAAGPSEIITQLVTAKQNSDQCSGALGQRMLEEYGRGGHLARQLVQSRALYARRAALMNEALLAHMPDGTTWTSPRGGFFTWVTAPDGVELAYRQFGEGRPLVLVHPGGGTVLPYAVLARWLGNERDVYAIEAPDGLREFTVESLARRYLPDLPEGPLLLGGWSFGGLVAL